MYNYLQLLNLSLFSANLSPKSNWNFYFDKTLSIKKLEKMML